MIFTHLTLHNYAAFRGKHVLELAPVDRERPVVLVGALNGSGKTSLLDAFHLALYGKRARTSNRGDLAWPEYLRQCVHNGAQAEGAAVELGIRHRRDGVERTLVVRRQWIEREKTVAEQVDVLVDGRRDAILAEHWDEEVEGILPLGIASLFLFDAEKIEQLADLQQAQLILNTAIEGLLGLELISQLDLDLRALPQYLANQQKKQSAHAGVQHAEMWKRAEEVQREVDRLAALVDKHVQDLAATQNELDAAVRDFDKADREWSNGGGTAYVNRAVLERKRAKAEQERSGCEARWRELIADALPFAGVLDQLQRVAELADREEQARRQAVVVAELRQRDENLLALLANHDVAPKLRERVESFLTSDRGGRERAAHCDTHLGLSAAGRGQVQALVGGLVERQVEEARTLQSRIDRAELEMESASRGLARVPDETHIARLSAHRDAALAARAKITQRQADLTEAHRQAESALRAEQARLAAMLAELVAADQSASRERQLLGQAQEIRVQLQAFRHVAVQRHTKRIAAAVLECFQSLIRKTSLLESLEIDPQTYAVTLYDATGRVLPPKRLSAGERQLLATSLLWGLGRVSGRVLPTVIDTPLGRMDSRHRRNLVERYFPHASHQVVLLSTDEEINGGWLAALQPAIGRTYLLEHDDVERRTEVRTGYFSVAN